MKKLFSTISYFLVTFFFIAVGSSEAQSSVLLLNFESNSIGDSLAHIGWSSSDVQSVVANDPVTNGNKVLKNTIKNYNAAPVLKFILPSGKTLADITSFTFKGYFAQGDVGYKDITVEAYQKKPTGQFANNASAKIGSFTRSLMGSTAWENITINIPNTSVLKDTIYISFGINCAGTGNVGGTSVPTIWYADNITLVPKAVTSLLSWNFESSNIGDSLAHIGWAPSDVQAVVANDPVTSGNKVLKNTIKNYNAAPVLQYILPSGKTLADYSSFTFKGYFAQGDVGYKDIVVEAYQKKPTAQFANNANAKIGSFTRSLMGSTAWENIIITIPNTSVLKDTIYIAFGINCAGTGNVGGTSVPTIWYADEVTLVPKQAATTNIVTNGSFENTKVGVVDSTNIKGWLIQKDSGLDPKFEIINTQAKDGNQSLKITLNQIGANPWSIQLVADSLKVNPGDTYNYSIWAKADKAGAQVNFTVGNYAFSEYSVIRPATLTTDWKEYTMTFTISDQQKVVRAPIHFSIAVNAGNVIYLDNLNISKQSSTNTYNGPALANGKSKFLGNIYSSAQIANFTSYWNQVIPENAGKWGSVEGTKDVMNWTELDAAYNLAINNKLPFNFHVLVWGQQQPSWMTDGSLTTAQQLAQITEWFKAVAARYPKIDVLQVVNEALPGHNPAQYKAALGGDGTTGWDWVINAFQLARDNFPKTTKLIINDYGIIGNSSATSSYLKIIRLLKSKNLIDGIGEQGHAFSTQPASVTSLKASLDSLWSTGLPIYITEMDVDGTSDDVQLAEYKRIFPTIWEHRGIYGVTLWGWRRGLWRDAQGAYLINTDGSERPSMAWLKTYVQGAVVNVKHGDVIPSSFQLYDNYPNPFNPSTNISYNIAQETNVKLEVFDVLGRHVQTLVNQQQTPGRYSVDFNASKLTSGVYIYRLQAGSFSSVKKLLLMK